MYKNVLEVKIHKQGRYRQFTQFGVEIINPKSNYLEELIAIASDLVKLFGIKDFEIKTNVTRGLDYYKEGKGFEITYDKLGSSKQICGGGEYDGGIGFAIGVDRLLSLFISK
jgi:histidyl-tRNA synthetase